MQERILIVNPYGIGDLLFSTPLFRNLKSYFPESYIAVAVSKNNVSVLENNPNVDKIIPFSRGDFKNLYKKSKWKGLKLVGNYIKTVYTGKFDLYFDLSMEYRYALIAKLLNINPRLGYNYKNRGRFLTHKIDLNTGYENKHVVEHHLELLKYLGLKPKYYNLELHLTEQEKGKADEYLKKLKIKDSDMVIGMMPAGGITWGDEAKYKHWPPEYYLKIANKLVKKYNARILLFGSRRERFICDKIFNDRIKENVYNLAGQINLRIFAAMLKKCKLAICNDGGPLHVADSQNVPTISFFGPVDENIYGPYPPNSKRVVLSKDLPCRPCYKNFKVPECEYNHRCFEEIKVGEVLEKAKNLLQ